VGDTLRLGASFVGYLLVVYFAVVLLIGVAAGGGCRTAWTSSCPAGPCRAW
jgi:hypothetical protein